MITHREHTIKHVCVNMPSIKDGYFLINTNAVLRVDMKNNKRLNEPKTINRGVLLLILVHVQLLSCLFFLRLASLQLKTMSLNIAQQFMKEMVKIYFGLLEIQVEFLIN